jgi:hypothetical protein
MLNLHNLTEDVANTQTERAARMGEVRARAHAALPLHLLRLPPWVQARMPPAGPPACWPKGG